MSLPHLFEPFSKSIALPTQQRQGSSFTNSMFHNKLEVSIFVNFSTIWTQPSEFVAPAKFATLPSGGSVQYAASTLVAHTIHNNNNNNNNNNVLNGLWIDLYDIVAQSTSHHRSLSGGRVTCAKTTSILSSGTTQNKTARKIYT